MLAFRNRGPDGSFVGELTDPVPIRWATDGSALQLDAVAAMTDATPQPAERSPNGTDNS
jgi:hypothetical protein